MWPFTKKTKKKETVVEKKEIDLREVETQILSMKWKILKCSMMQ